MFSSIFFANSSISFIIFLNVSRLTSVLFAEESSGAASAKKTSGGFVNPSWASFLGGIPLATPDLAPSLALSPGRVPWRLAQDGVAEFGSSVPGSSPVSEGVLDFSLART